MHKKMGMIKKKKYKNDKTDLEKFIRNFAKTIVKCSQSKKMNHNKNLHTQKKKDFTQSKNKSKHNFPLGQFSPKMISYFHTN